VSEFRQNNIANICYHFPDPPDNSQDAADQFLMLSKCYRQIRIDIQKQVKSSDWDKVVVPCGCTPAAEWLYKLMQHMSIGSHVVEVKASDDEQDGEVFQCLKGSADVVICPFKFDASKLANQGIPIFVISLHPTFYTGNVPSGPNEFAPAP
jgi:hypothetical protein